MLVTTTTEFERFVTEVEPRLRRAFAGALGPDRSSDAVSEALAWAWENRDRLDELRNPVGYLFRVGQSRTRRPKRPELPPPDPGRIPTIEPGLVDGLLALSENQRTAVWLVHACSWSHAEVAEAMELGTSTVATHVSRGLDALRNHLGEVSNG
ncbi:MAG: sigma-70 family RNA polymerase sigma factor [Acidimicrobiia bacterium]|nr:sigma-70 family RNA polymerase sigma factor [Acidimicrobiia bacterium]